MTASPAAPVATPLEHLAAAVQAGVGYHLAQHSERGCGEYAPRSTATLAA